MITQLRWLTTMHRQAAMAGGGVCPGAPTIPAHGAAKPLCCLPGASQRSHLARVPWKPSSMAAAASWMAASEMAPDRALSITALLRLAGHFKGDTCEQAACRHLGVVKDNGRHQSIAGGGDPRNTLTAGQINPQGRQAGGIQQSLQGAVAG